MIEPTVNELFDLSGKVALITGASGWLGRAFADALAEAGANVVAASRDSDTAKRSAAKLSTERGNVHFSVTLDQLDEKSIHTGFDAAVAAASKVDILVNNGHCGNAMDLTNAQAEDFDSVLKNATGYFLLARCLRDHVVARQAAGNVILIGSMYGQVASYPDAYQDVCQASPVSYHALKGGIIHMARHLAVYWASDKVRVNCLSPGPFPNSKAPSEMVERLKTKSPMGRMGLPYELKGALVFLASGASSYMTGQNLTIDGGWTAW